VSPIAALAYGTSTFRLLLLFQAGVTTVSDHSVPTPRSGGVDVIADTVSANGDIVGRDKVIQNIILVGQLLEPV
jgi:hypothetical protein